MLDFGELLRKDSQHVQSTVSDGISSIQCFRSNDVKNLVEETFRFDGHPPPIALPYKFKDVANQIEEHHAQLVVIDLCGCPDTIKESKQLSSRLPTSVSVVVLGDVDSISVVRELKALGFYYLLWPVEKIELAEFVQSVVSRHIAASNFKNRRRAKRVGIVGIRGGIGCSLLTSELAWFLSHEKQTSCLVVDHNYMSSSLDILLGLKNRDKRTINDSEVTGDIDATSAKTLVTKVSNRLDYLALGLQEERSIDLHDINDLVISHLSNETNFVIDDYSASVGFDVSPHVINASLDIAVIMMEPTISCLRETSAMLGKLKKLMEEPDKTKSLRILLVLNQHRASRFSSVNVSEIEKYLDHKIDIEFPYEISIEENLLNGVHLSTGKSKFGDQVRRLCALMIGEDLSQTSKRLFSFSMLGRK
ncbi:AAA family ATPase [Enterovibrio norvegicus]|uniref:Pilus assembly protein CpaE n=1 Tax=Enterovibrio norvegicus DSM 15893 TaxID=1121869 RepID=A0A1I5KQT0_9GAMM|nr:type II secretion protein ATPase [Enterovibrio norvegicus]SFO86791.1 pilus assembly protein CpaE [Enterovibrio norvegicus DSM 15893]